MKMPLLLMSLAGVLLCLGVVESLRHARRIRKIPVRILVNGTRGKTSVTRLITAALQSSGRLVRGKCTGTDPREILPNGSEYETPRPHGARITEMKGFFARAVKDGSDAVVIECMAVRPEMQHALARHLVKPTITVITNTLVDHIDEMGATRTETAQSLRHCLIPGTELVTDEAFFLDWPALFGGDKDPLPEDYTGRFSFPVYESNLRLALSAATLAGASRETALLGMPKARPDTGMAGPFYVKQTKIYNAFAANDPVSTALLAQNAARALAGNDRFVILYNNRADREYRLKSFVQPLQDLATFHPRLHIMGDSKNKVSRYFARRLPYPCQPLDVQQLQSETFYETDQVVLCVGNIKGDGHAMIEYLIHQGAEQ